MKRLIFDEVHEALRATTREFIERELMPNADKWESERLIDRSVFVAAGKYGLIGFNMPEEYGGGGSNDFRFNAVINEEIARYGGPAPSLGLQNDVVAPYFKHLATEGQMRRWMPGIASGETYSRFAMTEPGAGSDRIAAQKTFDFGTQPSSHPSTVRRCSTSSHSSSSSPPAPAAAAASATLTVPGFALVLGRHRLVASSRALPPGPPRWEEVQ